MKQIVVMPDVYQPEVFHLSLKLMMIDQNLLQLLFYKKNSRTATELRSAFLFIWVRELNNNNNNLSQLTNADILIHFSWFGWYQNPIICTGYFLQPKPKYLWPWKHMKIWKHRKSAALFSPKGRKPPAIRKQQTALNQQTLWLVGDGLQVGWFLVVAKLTKFVFPRMDFVSTTLPLCSVCWIGYG